MRRMILPLMLVFIVACQPPEPQATTTGPDVDAIKAALDQAVTADNAGDVDGVMAVYADDAVSFPPDAPPWRGIDTIRTRLGEEFAGYTMQFTATPSEVVVAGDVGVMQASWEETLTPKGGGEPMEMAGHWLIVWRKQPDGSWKEWREMWSVEAPPPPPAN
jgi:uncharacterized protein (TIGR02246 family)